MSVPWRHLSSHLARQPLAYLFGALLAASVLLFPSAPALGFASTLKASPVPSLQSASDTLALLAAQQAELTAPYATYEGMFGCSVALSGDTALVGANGTAYVFTRSGTTWSQQATLTDPNWSSGDEFGAPVALDGDTALVSSPGQVVDGYYGVGAVYVFTRSNTTWSLQATLADPNWSPGATNHHFGYPLALSGDTALVGANGGPDVFTRSGTSWSQQAELSASDAAPGDDFGDSVALSGDTALVGDRNKTVGGQADIGAVYVFTRSGTSWSQQAELTDPDAAATTTSAARWRSPVTRRWSAPRARPSVVRPWSALPTSSPARARAGRSRRS